MLPILFYGLLASGAEVIGGMVVAVRRSWPVRIQGYLLALSAGFLLALVFFELIPESLSILGSSASLYIVAGFGLLHFFEHTIVGHLHFGEETHTEIMVSRVASLSAFTGLFIHSLFDGVAIASGLEYNYQIGLLVFLAILLHKIPEGFTIASIMIAAKETRTNSFVASIAIGVATMIGIVLVLLIAGMGADMVGIAFAFSAGAATYVGASDLIPEINRSKNRIIPVIVFAGMVLFYVTKQALLLILSGK